MIVSTSKAGWVCEWKLKSTSLTCQQDRKANHLLKQQKRSWIRDQTAGRLQTAHVVRTWCRQLLLCILKSANFASCMLTSRLSKDPILAFQQQEARALTAKKLSFSCQLTANTDSLCVLWSIFVVRSAVQHVRTVQHNQKKVGPMRCAMHYMATRPSHLPPKSLLWLPHVYAWCTLDGLKAAPHVDHGPSLTPTSVP